MAFDLKKLVSNVATASADNRSDYIQPGQGRLAIIKIEHKDGHKGPHFICEFEVKAAEKNHATINPNRVGSKVALVLPLTGKRASSSANTIRALCEAAAGKKDLDNDDISAIIDPANEKEVAGTEVNFTATQIKTQAGGDFTRISFYPAT